MAREIATQQAVNKIAEALASEGVEPTTIEVQSRLHGGSYTTIKGRLDVWRQDRAKAAATSVEVPQSIQARVQEFGRSLWSAAVAEVRRETQQARDDAQSEVAAIGIELAGATAEIARLEGIEVVNLETIEQLRASLRQAELEQAEARAKASRVVDLEQQLSEARAQVSAALATVTEKAVEAATATGEAQALRAQVQQLLAAASPKRPAQ